MQINAVETDNVTLQLIFVFYRWDDLGGGRRDDRSVFSGPPGLTVSVLTSALVLT